MGSTARPAWRAPLAYGAMILVTALAFLLIRAQGQRLDAPAIPVAERAAAPAGGHELLLHILIALAAIVLTGQLLGRAFVRLGQPPVIGEVVAGILLGPSLIGPELSARILPPSVAPTLGVIAQIGVILYMFLVGVELDTGLLRRRLHATVLISHTSILFPFLLGALLSLALYPRFSSREVPFTSFALFMGVAMAITAFPVLARILTDSKMSRSELGVLALSCAAIDDVTAWCLLAFVSGVARAQVGQGLGVLAAALAYVGLMFLLARPALRRLAARWEGDALTAGRIGLVLVCLLGSALAAEAIGIHAIFGAFLLGLMVPHDSGLARRLQGQTELLVTVLFLPAFFAATGMRTRIDLLAEPSQWLFCGLIILIATLGKLGGTVAAARLVGIGWRPAAILGSLMNTRGLMELIVLNVGLELGVISPTLFAMMVLMALATTMMTSPLLRVLRPHSMEPVAVRP